MILHVAVLDKFIPPFIEFLSKNFDSSQNRFWLNGDSNRYSYQESPSTYQVKLGVTGKIAGYLRLAADLNRAEKVILHGFFDPKILILLSIMPWLLGKCYWVIWGGDLYVRKLGKKDWKWRLKELFRRFVIKRIGHLVTYIEGDVALAREWYGATGKYHECLMYTSNIYKELGVQKKQGNTINIQVGNSADPSNNHIEALEKLIPYKDDDVCIYVPLSYGDQQYATRVIEQGHEWFGEKFKPLTDFMPFDEYLDFLGKIDIAIFNHKRQQAMGNTITLLGLGKKIYMRNDVTQWAHFLSKNLTIYNVGQVNISLPVDLEIEVNKKVVKEQYNSSKLIAQWGNILSD